MSNESTTPGQAEQPRPSLPQFDPNRQDTQALPAAAPTSELPITPPSTPYAYAVTPAHEGTAPIAGPSVPLAATGLRWSAKKTAVTAGLAVVLASAGAIGAAAALPAGSTDGDSFRGPGGGRNFQFPSGNGQGGFGRQNQQLPNQQNQNGQQLPNLQNGGPGGLTGIDPNQMGQLDPQDLLDQLNQLNGGTGSGQGSGSDSDGAKTT